MPIQSYTLGDGQLILDDGTPFDISLQVTGCKITPSESVQSTDPVKVLGGGELAGDDIASYTYNLSGNLIQDIAPAGVVEWTWAHEGEYVEATFIPSDAAARQWVGMVRVIPLVVGGDDVGQKPRSDFDWRYQAKPVSSAVA